MAGSAAQALSRIFSDLVQGRSPSNRTLAFIDESGIPLHGKDGHFNKQAR
ncbi:hypothetical protein [Testudinibacter sp. TR-2022]|nr:hypothetical protein [Testudinibacter sp. TR-2022]